MPATKTRNGQRRGAGTGRTEADNIFFASLAILISATAFAGFSFTYFGPITAGAYPRAGVPLHVHGWSFFLWYLVFPLQAVLVAKGKRGQHRTLGLTSIALVVLMTLTGILVLTVRVEEAVRNGAPAVWLLYGPLFLANLILFVAFYAAAIYMAMRRRFQAHKRLIVVAGATGVGAGFSRVIMFMTDFHPLSIPAGTLGAVVFMIMGASYDWGTRRVVHPVYWIGIAALVVLEFSVLPQVNAGAVAWINQWLAALGKPLGLLYQPHPTVEF